MKTEEQKRQERGNLIVGIVCVVIILFGIIYNLYFN